MFISESQKRMCINNGGAIEVSSGAYLTAMETIMSDQKEWPETDHLKNFDFSTHAFWVVCDDGKFEPVAGSEL